MRPLACNSIPSATSFVRLMSTSAGDPRLSEHNMRPHARRHQRWLRRTPWALSRVLECHNHPRSRVFHLRPLMRLLPFKPQIVQCTEKIDALHKNAVHSKKQCVAQKYNALKKTVRCTRSLHGNNQCSAQTEFVRTGKLQKCA